MGRKKKEGLKLYLVPEVNSAARLQNVNTRKLAEQIKARQNCFHTGICFGEHGEERGGGKSDGWYFRLVQCRQHGEENYYSFPLLVFGILSLECCCSRICLLLLIFCVFAFLEPIRLQMD